MILELIMIERNLADQISGVAALDEPVRRALYLFVSGQPGEVSRDDAAQAVDVTRALAAFHLDKLVEEGLLEVTYRRLSGRTGPGAGRPSKLYHRSNRRFDVSLPPRRYELLARLFAAAFDESGAQLAPALQRVVRDFGAALGAEAREQAGPHASREALLDAAQGVLATYGFEPARDVNGDIQLRNCPFHEIADAHRQLVCGMNLSLMQSVIAGLGIDGVTAQLAPRQGMCCVEFRRETHS